LSVVDRLAALLALLSGSALVGCGGAPIDRQARSAEVVLSAIATPEVRRGVAAPEPEAAPLRNEVGAPGSFAFVERGDGGTWLVLARTDADQAAGIPALRTDPASGFVLLEAKARVAQLDREMRLEGRRFDLWEGDQKVCTVRAGAVRIMAVTATPPDFMDPHATPDEGAPTGHDVAALWSVASHYVAIPIEVPPSCARAEWARLAELPEPRFASARSPVPAGTERDAVAAFRASPAWAQAQRDFVEVRSAASPGAGPLGTWEEAGSAQLVTWDAPFAGGTYVVRRAAWDEGCSFSVGLTMVWSQSAEGLRPMFEADDRFDVDQVLDLDGDGTLEMIGSDAAGRELRRFWPTRSEGEAPELLRYGIPSHGCGC
jgi:hypothetical protein